MSHRWTMDLGEMILTRNVDIFCFNNPLVNSINND